VRCDAGRLRRVQTHVLSLHLRRILACTLVAGAIVPGSAGAAASAPAAAAGPPVPASGLTTRWTGGAWKSQPLDAYPRPQLQRAAWQCLNGEWEYEPARSLQAPPVGRRLSGRVVVPYPVEAPLSGVAREDTGGWYRRLFRLPRAWAGRHVILNFGAVAWLAEVYVNGHLATRHQGSYDSFSVDITALLRPGENELIVGFLDLVGLGQEPVGKQVLGTPSGFMHTASSGIWQTVWLEPVNATHLSGLTLTPRLTGPERLQILATLTGNAAGATLQAAAYAGSRRVATATARAGTTLTLPLARARLWSPSDPYLYTLHLRLVRGSQVLDQLSSYFGMRQVSLGRVNGIVRILLNGRPLFEAGALDQGMWPDGLYTPPSDDAMRADILSARALGFNMLREHAKVEPDRWYMWADRLGMLVWQDMPSMPIYGDGAKLPAARSEFREELTAVVTELRSHPSIVTWVPFNEGWQAFDLPGVVALIRRLDQTRLIDADSGSATCCGLRQPAVGDLRDGHVYFGPFAVPPEAQASVEGEFGGVLPVAPAGHRYPGTPTSIGSPVLAWSLPDISAIVQAQYANLAQEARTGGLSAAVFTELTATEQELGLITYDRRETLLAPALFQRGNAAAIAAEAAATQPPAEPQAPGSAKSVVSPQAAAVPSHAAASWSFDEGRGNSAGPAPDLTLSPGTGWTRGVSGEALRLSAPGQGAQSAGPILDTTRAFTVSAWVRLASVSAWSSAVSEEGAGGPAFLLGVAPTGTGWSGWSFGVATAPGCAVSSCGVVANLHYADERFAARPGGWHLLGGSFDPRGDLIVLYVDGLLEDIEHVTRVPHAGGALEVGSPSPTASGPSSGTSSSPGATPPPALLGAVDEVRLWPRMLTPAEEWALYAATRPGAAPAAGRLGPSRAAARG
jgi:hypothetical protein